MARWAITDSSREPNMTGSNKQKVFLSDEWSKFTRPGYTVEKKKIYLGVPNNETEILNSYSPLYGTDWTE